jgi:hypothetical protein
VERYFTIDTQKRHVEHRREARLGQSALLVSASVAA